MGARYYDATYGRFLTRDTELSQSPYAYCDSDPVNFSDPSGHAGAWNQPWKTITHAVSQAYKDIASNPYFQKSTYNFSAADNAALDQESLIYANRYVDVGGLGGTGFGIAGKVSTSQISTLVLTSETSPNVYLFAAFAGVALGGATIKGYWAAGQALGAWK